MTKKASSKKFANWLYKGPCFYPQTRLRLRYDMITLKDKQELKNTHSTNN